VIDSTCRNKLALAAVAAWAALALASTADAQTMTANSASYNAGYGRAADEENQPVDVSLRDANGNPRASSPTSAPAGSSTRPRVSARPAAQPP
jgi:hypothetical protein